MRAGQWLGILGAGLVLALWLTFVGAAAFAPRALQRFQLAALDRFGVPRDSWRSRLLTSRWYVWQLRVFGLGSLAALIGWLLFVTVRKKSGG